MTPSACEPLDCCVVISTRCNLRCGFCGINRDNPDVLSEAECDRVVRWSHTRPLGEVLVFGGEPFLHFDRLQRLAAMRCRAFDIITNGLLIGPDQEAWLRDHPHVKLKVAADGLPVVHRRLRGADPPDLPRLRRLPNHVGINMTVVRRELDSLAAGVASLRHMGFDEFWLNMVKEEPYGPEDLDRFERAFSDLAALALDHNLFVSTLDGWNPDGSLYCRLDRRGMTIGPDGRVYLCMSVCSTYPRLRPGAVPRTSVRLVLGENCERFGPSGFRYPPRCAGCEARPYCLHCPAASYWSFGDFDVIPDWFCDAMRRLYRIKVPYIAAKLRRAAEQPVAQSLP